MFDDILNKGEEMTEDQAVAVVTDEIGFIGAAVRWARLMLPPWLGGQNLRH